MSKLESGLQAWRQMTNHNRMIDIQDRGDDHADPHADGEVEIAFFGSSSFRITTPDGITLMVDPWRNFPTEKWDWYFRDFPHVPVDVGVSSHAHFDHDALHRLDAHVLLDRLIGRYEFGDLRYTTKKEFKNMRKRTQRKQTKRQTNLQVKRGPTIVSFD